MIERLHAYLTGQGKGVPARLIVQDVMRLRGAQDDLCERLVRELVGQDRRFHQDAAGLWRAGPHALLNKDLRRAPVMVIHLSLPSTAAGHPVLAEVAFEVLAEDRERVRYATPVRPDEPMQMEVLRNLGLTDGQIRRAPEVQIVLDRLFELGRDTLWVVWESRRMRRLVERTYGMAERPPVLHLDRCCHLLFPDLELRTLTALAALFTLPCPEQVKAEDGLSLLREAYFQLVEILHGKGIGTVGDALGFQDQGDVTIDFSRYCFDRAFLDSLPETPGVYIMRDREDRAVYVGKGKDLRSRVGSYFLEGGALDEKRHRILESVYRIDVVGTATEPEALILEAEEIARLLPPINRQMAVHERATPYAKGHNLIILCPGAEGLVNILFTGGGALLERITVGQEDLDLDRLLESIKTYYASRSIAAPSQDTLKRELFSSWIEANRERLVSVDYDLCEGPRDAARLVIEYAGDILNGNPRVFRV